jgi:hemerythrin
MEYKFNWTIEMSVGEDHIDEQHKKILSQVNKILEAIALGRDYDVVDETISFFDQYIKDHFTYEEEYMREIGFPNIEKHIEKHDNFRNTYKNLKERREHGISNEELILEVETYIGNWWFKHIGQEDKEYYLFIKNK